MDVLGSVSNSRRKNESRKVAIVIPVFNRREITLQVLRSLARIKKDSFESRIFVVDDGSSDGTSEAIRQHFPSAHLIQGTGSLHYAGGTNRGIEKALEWDPEYILTMNDDAIVHEDLLARMILTSQANDRTIVGALLLLWNEPHKVFQVGQYWKTLKGGWVIPDELTAFNVPEASFEVECIVGNCVLFPTSAILENGLLDEARFPHGWGDAQYLNRMRKAGWKLMIEPKAYCWCEPNTYPAPLHEFSLVDIWKNLFSNERYPLNLRRQLIARWESSPGKVRAMIAFFAFLLHLSGKSLRYGLLRIFQKNSVPYGPTF